MTDLVSEQDAAVQKLCAQVGYSLRMARLHRRATLSYVAEQVKISVDELQRIERGENYDLSLRVISDICFALGHEPVLKLEDSD
jgi:transcriptional regulator with XRE-family HTH domain